MFFVLTYYLITKGKRYEKRLDSIELGEFDEENYAKYEAARRKWQKINFPIEFEQSEQLRKLANRNKLF